MNNLNKFSQFNESLKPRKGFKKIVVDGEEFLYSVSQPKNGGVDLILYNPKGEKNEIRNIHKLNIPKSEFISKDGSPVWKGKHDDAAWGKRPISWVIKNKLRVNESTSHDISISLTSDELEDDFYNFKGDLRVDVKISFDDKYSGSVSSDGFEFNFKITDGVNVKIFSNSPLPKRIIMQKIVDKIAEIINQDENQ